MGGKEGGQVTSCYILDSVGPISCKTPLDDVSVLSRFSWTNVLQNSVGDVSVVSCKAADALTLRAGGLTPDVSLSFCGLHPEAEAWVLA